MQVNLLLDGIFHGMKGQLKSVIYTFAAHPNINLKFYEPLNIFMPWTINNRMHDKYIISDKTLAIIGGRNIGDKYFAPEWYNKAVTNDRDIIIVNTDSNNLNSVLYKMSDYFNLIFNHKYSKPAKKRLTSIKYNKGYMKGEELKAKIKLIKDSNKELFDNNIDIMAISSPTNKVSFIHNPIQRFSKEPWSWYEISQLMKNAKQSIFIQSPYVIPSRQMTRGFVDKELIKNLNVSILTNSLASSPNIPGYSGYINHRKKIIDSGINVYEIQSKDSIHTKAFIIDEDLALIGSFNLDSRSTYLSTESMVVIHSSDVVKKVNEGLVDYKDQSLLVSSNYNYVPNKGIEKLESRFVKKFTIKLLSYILRKFEYLL